MNNLESSQSDHVLYKASIVMAHKLGIHVVAEGIETEGQLNPLQSVGWDYGQEYFFRPVPAPDFEANLVNRGT